jgi:DNA-binding NtrC family response regulator
MNAARGRILVVDDKPNMLTLLEQILGEHHSVTLAADGQQALERLADEEFDLVLTDVRMPGADGFEVLRTAKRRRPATEVIVMTAYASIGAAVEAIKRGAYDYVRKPFDPDDVVLVVARALEHASQRAQERVPDVGPEGAQSGTDEDPLSVSFKDAVNQASDEASRDYLSKLMRTYSGNVTLAAQRAGLQRESLHRLLKRYGLRAEAFRAKIEPGSDDPPDHD